MTPSQSYSIISQAAIERYLTLLERESYDSAYIKDVQSLYVQYAALVSHHSLKEESCVGSAASSST